MIDMVLNLSALIIKVIYHIRQIEVGFICIYIIMTLYIFIHSYSGSNRIIDIHLLTYIF